VGRVLTAATMNLSKNQREELRMMFGGRCAYCGCVLPDKGWHADHVEAVYREWWKSSKWWREAHSFKWEADPSTGYLKRVALPSEKAGMERPENDTLSNLFPACAPCNIDKSAATLEGWRKIIQDKVGVLRRNYKAFGHAERFGLVVEVKKPIVFWFETCALGEPK
jgi:hypothetical protein